MPSVELSNPAQQSSVRAFEKTETTTRPRILSESEIAAADTSRIGSFNFCGLHLSTVGPALAVKWVHEHLTRFGTTSPVTIVNLNAQVVDEAIRNTGLRDALKKAHLVCADGMSIVWGGRFLGCPEVEPLPGEELMDYLCAAGDARGDSIFLLGAMPGVAELAAAKLKEQYPGLRIAGVASPPVGFERDRVELDRIREQLKAAAPMLLFVGFGAPKQEIWMRDELPGLPVGAALAVGAAIDTTAGLRKASPIWMKRRGIAWIYRLVHEPRRLWRRYLFGNSRFVATVMAAWLTQRLERFQLNN